MMISTDHMGVTSIVRELSLNTASYKCLLHFFRAESYQLSWIEWKWQTVVSKLPLLYRWLGRVIMIGDGVKQTKEGRFMPGVKKLHQESENSAKGEYIFGHMFGGVGILIGDMGRKMYCVLISLRLHDGLKSINAWGKDEEYVEESHVEKIIHDAGRASRIFGKSVLLLDRLFLTNPMLNALVRYPLIEVITKAKKNAKAYYHPEPKKGPGRKAEIGPEVKVLSLFDSMSSAFVAVKAQIYGIEQEVSYYCVDLLWGEKLKESGKRQTLRFVLVWLDGVQSILTSTDLTLAPKDIIELYCHRFKIECAFREFKQVIAGFCYRFWSKHMPKLNRFKPNDVHQEKLADITDGNARTCIRNTVEAIENYALFGCIALGLLQIISIQFSHCFSGPVVRFLRTTTKAIPSEATVADFMRKNLFRLFQLSPDLAITTIISERQDIRDIDVLGFVV